MFQGIVAWARRARKPPPPHLPVIVASCRLCLISGAARNCSNAHREPLMADKTLDLKVLTCPLPILKTRKALSGLPRGATLEVFATDPGSVPDFSAFCETTGNRMVEQDEANGVYRFVIEHRA
jgi:tRNA 2-thiouridine synthesizing protein A